MEGLLEHRDQFLNLKQNYSDELGELAEAVARSIDLANPGSPEQRDLLALLAELSTSSKREAKEIHQLLGKPRLHQLK